MSVLIVIFGAAALLRVPVRELPDVETAELTVSVRYVGASPAVIDAGVTTVIERATSQVPGIHSIESESELGSNRTVITFDRSRDIDDAAADVRAAVQAIAPDLPEEAETPEVEKQHTEGEPILRLTMTSDTMDRAALNDYAERYVVDRIETVTGVASVQIYDERAYAMRIWLEQREMAARDVTLEDIRRALRQNNLELPAGKIETGSRTFQVRTDTRLADIAGF